MYEDEKTELAKLIAEHKRLRKLMHDLDVQAASVDGRLVEIERELPATGVYPDDPPETRHH